VSTVVTMAPWSLPPHVREAALRVFDRYGVDRSNACLFWAAAAQAATPGSKLVAGGAAWLDPASALGVKTWGVITNPRDPADYLAAVTSPDAVREIGNRASFTAHCWVRDADWRLIDADRGLAGYPVPPDVYHPVRGLARAIEHSWREPLRDLRKAVRDSIHAAPKETVA
jgi:hypothetical protein